MAKYHISRKAIADLDYRVGHHIIFFKKHDDGSVWVDRVLHEKMDYQRHL
ncbi:MAG: hypothetical protein J6M23_08145 [Bacteroidales bacterium]|nr:hypothetical protein [Bacteroidales bacterium]